MNQKVLIQISQNLVSEKDDFMKSFRKNLDMYASHPDITLRKIADEADISYDTLTNLYYGNTKDCKLSTVISIAKALNVSIDELIGCGTLTPDEKNCISTSRELPESTRYLITWFINRQKALFNKANEVNKKVVPVMNPFHSDNGNLYLTNEFESIDISDLSDSVRPRIFLGINIKCDYYMPYYSPYDTILIANDRPPKPTENSVIIYGEQIFIARRHVDKIRGTYIPRFYSLRDGKFRVDECNVDDIIGYIAHVHHNTQYNHLF